MHVKTIKNMTGGNTFKGKKKVTANKTKKVVKK